MEKVIPRVLTILWQRISRVTYKNKVESRQKTEDDPEEQDLLQQRRSEASGNL
jgi:uncharacterized protein (UPF0305 family)